MVLITFSCWLMAGLYRPKATIGPVQYCRYSPDDQPDGEDVCSNWHQLQHRALAYGVGNWPGGVSWRRPWPTRLPEHRLEKCARFSGKPMRKLKEMECRTDSKRRSDAPENLHGSRNARRS